MFPNKKIMAAAVASQILIISVASAQPALEEVVVTAQKREQNMQDVGISVTAMSGDNLRSLGITSSADIASFTPNLSIVSLAGEGNQPVIFLRGIGLNDYNTNNAGPIGMYVDEVIVSSPTAQSFAMFDVERVEVLRGPQGTLYGRNTTGGAINVISNKPTGEFEADLLASYGNFNAMKLEGAVSGPLTDKLGARLAVVSNTADGYIDDVSSGKEYNETDNYAIRGLLQWDASDSVSALFNVHYGKNDTDAPRYIHYGTYDANTFDPTTGLFSGQCSSADISRQAAHCVSALGYQDNTGDDREGEWSRPGVLDFDVAGASAKVTWEISDNLSLISITAYDETEKLYEEDTDSSPQSFLEATYNVDSETFSQEFRLVGSSESTNWLLGFFYLNEELNQDQTLDLFRDLRPIFGFNPDLGTFFSRHEHQQETTTWAVYGQVEYQLAEQWLLTGGLRYTQEDVEFAAQVAFEEPDFSIPFVDFKDDIDNDNISGRLALNYYPNEDWMLYGSVTTGFKSGGFPGTFGFSPEEYQGYGPEEITAFEVGFKSTLADSRVQLNGAMFFYDYTDIQIYQILDSDSPVPVQRLTNGGDAEIFGGELELTAQPTEGLYLLLGLAYLDTEFQDLTFGDLDLSGNRLATAPEWSANGLARYDWSLGNGGGFYTQVDFTYSDEYFFDVFNSAHASQEAYTLLGARAGYISPDQNWELSLWGKNLSDEDYFATGLDLGEAFGQVEMIPTRPLTYGVELRVYFN
jgi:iron complex outermembrane receptor protein